MNAAWKYLEKAGFIPAFFFRSVCCRRHAELLAWFPSSNEVTVTLSICSPKDFWSGLLYMFFGLGAIIIARDYGMGSALKMGPAYFPTLLGWLLVTIGAISVVRGFVIRGTAVGGFAMKGLLMVVGATLLFGLTVRGAGLAIALPILVIFSAAASKRFRLLPTLLMAAGLTLFCVLVFLKGLGVPLPVVGPWLGG
jgi:putative tricarboxylic transport membrane protein